MFSPRSPRSSNFSITNPTTYFTFITSIITATAIYKIKTQVYVYLNIVKKQQRFKEPNCYIFFSILKICRSCELSKCDDTFVHTLESANCSYMCFRHRVNYIFFLYRSPSTNEFCLLDRNVKWLYHSKATYPDSISLK